MLTLGAEMRWLSVLGSQVFFCLFLSAVAEYIEPSDWIIIAE